MRKLLLPLLTILLFTSCQKQIAKEQITPEKITGDAVQGKSAMIEVCHKNGNGSWNTINISANALPAHLAHGDIVPDADKDGFTKENPCGIGNQDDCNDDDEAINPGATEICENNIDDNCNGQIDENCYPTIQICNQIWMQKNLAVDHYRNGDPIPQVTDPTVWASLTTGAWCYYNNDPTNGSIYGKLYNWFAVNDSRGLAPIGWHIPTDDHDILTSSEWQLLSDCLGGYEVAGGKMKSTSGWNNGGFNNNNNGTNTSGFTALPGGYRVFNGSYGLIGLSGFWWSSTETSPNGIHAWVRNTGFGNSPDYFGYTFIDKKYGFSVRCVKD